MNNQMVLAIRSILDVLEVKVIALEKLLFDELCDSYDMPKINCNDVRTRIDLLTEAIENLNDTRYILACIE